MVECVHDIPGRLRVRCEALRRNETGAILVRSQLDTTAGVTAVNINLLTGSVIMHYDVRKTTAADLLAVLDAHPWLSLNEYADTVAISPPFRAPNRARYRENGANGEPGAQIGRAVAAFMVEKAIERSLVALVSAVL
jgi:Heavy metal associated domain 2